MTPFPRISIVTPSYNQGKYLEQTLRSVLDQSYPHLEYVVIDAGSSDGSVEIIRKYAHRLRYWISEPDRGHADGINKGFSQTSGEIMGWINSSDVYYPWTLGTVAQVFADVPDAQWITGVATYLGDGSAPQDISPACWNLYDFLSGSYAWMQQESVFWRRCLWEAAGGELNPDTRYACDFELWLRFFRHASLYHVNTILAGFRYHEDRRGNSDNHLYRDEAAEHFAGFYSSFGRRDRWRARLVQLTNNRPGRLVRIALQELRIWPWYRHARIVRDLHEHRWVVA